MRTTAFSPSIITAVFINFAAFFCFSVSSTAVDNTALTNKHDQIRDIESRLSKEISKFEVFNFQEKDLLIQLADLEREASEKRQSIMDSKSKISISNRSHEKLKKNASELERLKKNTEKEAADRMVALYKYARKGGYATVLAAAQDFDQFFSRIKYIKAIMGEDREILEKLAHKDKEFRVKLIKIDEEIAREEAVKAAEMKHLKNLENELEQKVIQLVKIHKEKEFYETAVRELQLAAKNLRETLLNIGKNETMQILQPSRFIDSKGQLPFPLSGRIIKEDKIPESVRPLFDKGIFIEGTFDNAVKAVYSGKVVFSGLIKGYGDIVILNHGSRFFTISANLSRRDIQEGDLVAAGDVIGIVGGNGSSESRKLYFEIRKGGEKLDPLKWLKLH
ncbi:MAG: peptidoglycan DD-metalloendopeptidase family protein [Deltaproteobacteria bacterium]|nr:peptidoglycan DD-metalloendopeptidase family protein [Deltaproteobacteria bacterium]